MTWSPTTSERVAVMRNSTGAEILTATNGTRLLMKGDAVVVEAIDGSQLLYKSKTGYAVWKGNKHGGYQVLNVADVVPIVRHWTTGGERVRVIANKSQAKAYIDGQTRYLRAGDVVEVCRVDAGGILILVKAENQTCNWFGTTFVNAQIMEVADLEPLNKPGPGRCSCDNYTIGAFGCQCGWFQIEQEMKKRGTQNV